VKKKYVKQPEKFYIFGQSKCNSSIHYMHGFQLETTDNAIVIVVCITAAMPPQQNKDARKHTNMHK